MLPDTLERVGRHAFTSCSKIELLWVNNRLDICSLRGECVPDSVIVLSAKAVAGGAPLWDLRRQKEVTIPEGAQEIGEEWFKSSEVESVTIPTSIESIGKGAFCNCRHLKRVVFVEGRKTEKS